MPKLNEWDVEVTPEEWQSFWDVVNEAQDEFLGIDHDGDCRYRMVLMDRMKYEDVVLVPRIGYENINLADIEAAARVATEANSRLEKLLKFYRWNNTEKRGT